MFYLGHSLEIYPNNKQKTLLEENFKRMVNLHNLLVFVFIGKNEKVNSFFQKYDDVTNKILDVIFNDNSSKVVTKRKYYDKEIIKRIELYKLNRIPRFSVEKKIKTFKLNVLNFLKQGKMCPGYRRYFTSVSTIHYSALKVTKQGRYVTFSDFLEVGNNKINTFKISEADYFKDEWKICQPSISYDGLHYYICLTRAHREWTKWGKKNVIGVDLGIKHTTLSDGTVIDTVNKDRKVKILESRIQRIQDNMKRLLNENSNYISNNYLKQKHLLNVACTRLKNIRRERFQLVVKTIFDKNPSCVVIEDLSVMDMMKNHEYSKYLSKEAFAILRKMIETKGKKKGVEVFTADRYYPSSKKCSSCGYIKKDLTISDRIFKCNKCGFVIDRDLNAAINLKSLKS